MKLLMGAEISGAWAFSLSLTPVALAAAIKLQERNFTVPAGTPGLPSNITPLVTDFLEFIAPSQNNSLCPAVTAWVNATGQLTIGFSNLTAAANTPVAGTYSFFLVRP